MLLLCAPPSGAGDLAIIAVASPVLVAVAIQAKRPLLARFGAKTSYAIYAIHVPVLLIAKFVCEREHVPLPAPILATAVAVVVLAYLANRFYDGPARAWLSTVTLAAAPGQA
ncbi:MAG TPA: hypothetical protein VGL66_01435 [Caulobacteraceae bacterium]